MRRASTCLAVLGLRFAGAAGRRLGAADGHVQSPGRADPGLPGHRQHPRRRRRPEGRIHDLRHRIRRLAAAAHRRQLLPADRPKLHPTGFPTCSKADARTVRPGQVREGLRSRPGRHRARLRDLRQRTRRRDRRTVLLLRARRRLRVLHRRALAGVAGNPLDGPLRQLGGGGGFGPELITKVPLVASVPGAPFASAKTINVKAGSAIQERPRRRSTTGASRRNARKAASR